jgi:tRNA 2-selenouridine synthase
MTDLALDIREFLKLAQRLPVIDVRSPAEFEHAHIPGAVNLPLFSNEERSIIGTLYLHKGPEEAMTKGLDFIRPKMKLFAETGNSIAGNGEALMHCWRGGMRSNSMAWFMNTIGIKTYTLSGGYKSFRRYTAECFAKPLQLIVIGGMTGSGKTRVLKELKRKGMRIINLEELAGHKGSVFGGIGLPDQPSTEQFENDLFSTIKDIIDNEPVFIEDESLAIGKVFIPRSFYDQMSLSDFIRLDVPFEIRLKSLVGEYSAGSKDELITGVRRIEKRLGFENAAMAIKHISIGEMTKAAELILKYYDKIYSRSMELRNRKSVQEISITEETPSIVADIIISKFTKWN